MLAAVPRLTVTQVAVARFCRPGPRWPSLALGRNGRTDRMGDTDEGNAVAACDESDPPVWTNGGRRRGCLEVGSSTERPTGS
jgi:hypothetical protein